jgi:hypothetical protein
VSGVAQATAPQALDVYLTRPLCPGVVDLVDPVQVILQWDVVVDGYLVLDMGLEPFKGVRARQRLQAVPQFPLHVLELATKLAQVHGLLLECAAGTPVSPDLSLERDVLLEVEGFVDEHREQLVLEEEVFFFGTKNTVGVWVLAGSEVTGLDGATATACRKDLGEWGGKVILDKGDWDPGGAIERRDVTVVGVWDLTRAGVDADEGSIACRGATSFDKVADEVINGHDDGRVIDFGDGGCATSNVDDLL